ncbi:MAG: alpha/beta hydrolase [Bacteroidales bacterium]|nr:alpha/beta hydrolase [Bacteroidales bacterium]
MRTRLTLSALLLCALLCPVSLKGAELVPSDLKVDTLRYDLSLSYPVHIYLVRPRAAAQPLPCIVYVPGSAWKKQKMDRAVRNQAALALRGYAVAFVEYRPCSEALFPAQVEDVKTATRYLRERAARFGLDARNFFAWGSSSGAHTVLLHAFTQDSSLLDNEHGVPTSCAVNAVVDYYGPSELVHEFRIQHGKQERPDQNGGLLLGDPVEEKRDVAIKASPLYYVHPLCVPVFVAHGDADKVVPVEQSHWLVERLRTSGVRVEYVELPGSKHGGPAFNTPELLNRIFSFLDSCRITN